MYHICQALWSEDHATSEHKIFVTYSSVLTIRTGHTHTHTHEDNTGEKYTGKNNIFSI